MFLPGMMPQAMRLKPRTILLFTRAPEAEARAKRLPAAEGARLFTGFLKGWTQLALTADADLLVVTPEESASELGRSLPNVRVGIQSQGSFADRIESAFAQAFSEGAGAVLMVGGDSPPLDTTDLENAFQHLESNTQALVLTPADDGGVNSIGFSAGAQRPLDEIAWNSSDVCRQLLNAAHRCGLALLLTGAGYDLDSARDIGRLYRLSRSQTGWRAFRRLLLSVLLACRAHLVQLVEPVLRFAGEAYATRGPPLPSV
jgi:glycosyltransferase A (GT-A) superfamily protein (DUF2064 family)